ncbi:(Fe-S)-binding protein [uncultured Cohaesibacter sp.]|uniref:(Fe-S)-binding protein n=1 Tax=uncultured Cohaesibacter sp. TaxID=1002546 RepID=UPI0029C74525|nr:(Fe-S)-binding protein [uncultured Cohaesibacter sp.]
MDQIELNFDDAPTADKAGKRVGLFVTCLVDLFRPTVGFAAVKLIEDAGFTLEVPKDQTCCGQPAYNSGDREDAKALAKQVIKAFEGYDYIVAPSGSCSAMIAKHYPALLADEPEWADRAVDVAGKTHELVSFLVDVAGLKAVASNYRGTVTYHDSCSGLREMKVKDQPRQLLSSIEGVDLKEMRDSDVCCGFGGTFCVKYSDISNAIVEKKSKTATDAGAATLLAGDLGCLMNMAGKLKREGSAIEVRHVAEVLADMADGPAIGAKKQR